MRDYELTILINPELDEKEVGIEIKEVAGIIENLGGEVGRRDDPVKKSLAYPVDKKREAYYVYWEINLPAEKVAELEGKLRLREKIIRHLIIRD